MSSVAEILGEFVAAWTAGEHPRLNDYLSRVPEHDQDELAEQIRAYMLTAPEPEEYSEQAWAELSADPRIAEIADASMEPEPWPSLLPRLRERAGLSVAQLVDKLGVKKPEKAQQLYEEMERGDLDPEAPSRTLLERLGGIFGVSPEALDWRGAGPALARMMVPPPAPSAAPALLRSSAAEEPPEHNLDVLADAMTTEWDDVDELFLSGR